MTIETILEKQLAARARAAGPPAAIFIDLDGTYELQGHTRATAAALELTSAASEASCPLILVTGRAPKGVIARIERGELPPFPAIIGAVGTNIQNLYPDGTYRKDEEFARRLAARHYDRPAIVASSQDVMLGLNAERPETRITFQFPDDEAQFLRGDTAQVEPYKVSFFFFASQLHELEQVAAPFQAVFPDQRIVVCEEIVHNRTTAEGMPRRYCLDVVPVTKADAVDYMVGRYGIQEGVVGGDSGNDVDMLLHTSSRLVSVLVGGHSVDARLAIEAQLGEPGDDGFYRFGNKLVYIDRQPGRFAAESIVAVIRNLGRPLTI